MLSEPKATFQRLFDRLAGPYSHFVFSRSQEETRRFVAWIGPHARERVLDLACGPGTFTVEIAGYGCQVIGFDLAQAMIAQARRAARGDPLERTHYAVADCENLPLPAGKFDLVTCAFSFADFPNPHLAVAEMCRAACCGGRIAVIDVVCPEDTAQCEELNRLERLRSAGAPMRLLRLTDLLGLFSSYSLRLLDCTVRERRCPLEDWLALGDPQGRPHAQRRVRAEILETAERDAAGLHLERERGRWYCFPKIVSLLWRKEDLSGRRAHRI